MPNTYNKPAKLRYTQMCMYIDEHLEEIVELGKNPEVEEKIYEYIYHVVYALARKGLFFRKFYEYDDFALYAAGELFMAIHKKMHNAGQIIRGKEIQPLKSSLNYIKAVLHPLRVNYQQMYYHHIMDPSIGQDTSKMTYALKESIRLQYSSSLEDSCLDIANELPKLLNDILDKTPYRNNPAVRLKLFNSCMLSLASQLTLPNSKTQQLKRTAKSNVLKYDQTATNIYVKNSIPEDVILWNIDEMYSDYVRLLVRKLKQQFSINLREDIHADDLSENIVDSIIASTFMPQDTQNSED